MAQINEGRIAQVAAFLKANPPKMSGMNFYSVQTPKGELVLDTMYPAIDHPQAVDFFFLACLHQYGFWYGDEKGYVEPMIGSIGEKSIKGSDLLWTLLKRKLDADPSFFAAERLAVVTPKELADVFTDDVGTQWPDFEQRFKLTRQYGRWLLAIKQTPAGIVELANNSSQSLRTFLATVKGQYTGSPFRHDFFNKKQLLLAMVMANRPEKFLQVRAEMQWPPIVDYHLMRVALRLGLVELTDTPEIRTKEENDDNNVRRLWVDEAQEQEIRVATYHAIEEVITESGLSMATIDETFWMARKYCPEMTEPECDKCAFTTVCAKRTELFQPVLRTTAY